MESAYTPVDSDDEDNPQKSTILKLMEYMELNAFLVRKLSKAFFNGQDGQRIGKLNFKIFI